MMSSALNTNQRIVYVMATFRMAGASLQERLQRSFAEEPARVTFGKSPIHQWGLFSKRPIAEGELVMEYRGELISAEGANSREALYRSVGVDCYLFKISENMVIDGSLCGGIGRLINHSCGPNLYSKIVDTSLDGPKRIAFFANRDLPIGTELTYDYRFKEENDDEKIACFCGSPACRGTLN